MQRGHPFLTEELDAQRVEQRRLLRSVPDWVIARIVFSALPRPPASAADRALVETQLRALVDPTTIQPELWERMKRHSDIEASVQWLQGCDRGFDSTLNAIADDILTIRNENRFETIPNPSETVPALHRIVHLLAYADRLSNDGYEDSRVAARVKDVWGPPES